LFEESLALARQLAWPRLAANNLSNLALMALYGGSYQRSDDLFVEALQGFNGVGDRRGVAETLEGLAGVAGVEGRAAEAARLFGVAEALREELGAPVLGVDQARYDSLVSTAREQLDRDSWSRAFAEGRSAPLETALAALTSDAAGTGKPRGTPSATGLHPGRSRRQAAPTFAPPAQAR
jgi:hypothetical protein